ncbi:hypothetical protein BJX66DRAFT_301946 [Aspergillus keveii]|uniref:Uncharacterized protein n=1 Tax=Aspergillus keveii TaxID=714993 RepID=A0ABR4G8M0_9EURO
MLSLSWSDISGRGLLSHSCSFAAALRCGASTRTSACCPFRGLSFSVLAIVGDKAPARFLGFLGFAFPFLLFPPLNCPLGFEAALRLVHPALPRFLDFLCKFKPVPPGKGEGTEVSSVST